MCSFIIHLSIIHLYTCSSSICWNLCVCVCERCSGVSDSLWPHELYSPWNSLDQNTGVGSHFLLQGIFLTWGLNPDLPHCKKILYQLSHKWSEVKVAQLCPTLCDPMDCPWNSPGQNTGMGSLSLLQGIFPTQWSNPSLSHCRWILYQLSHKGSPKILEWVAYHLSADLPDPGIEPGSPALQADSLPIELSGILKKRGRWG